MDKLYDEAEYPTRTAIIKALQRMGACENGIAFVQGCESWKEAWDKCEEGSWMEWYLRMKRVVEIRSASERAQEINKLNELIDTIPKDAPCGCGCGLNLYFGPESEKKLAALIREHYPVAPTSPADLEKHVRFNGYFN